MSHVGHEIGRIDGIPSHVTYVQAKNSRTHGANETAQSIASDEMRRKKGLTGPHIAFVRSRSLKRKEKVRL